MQELKLVTGLWQQPANIQERVTNEILSFVGTGDFLDIPPRKLLDDNLGSAGTQHKWATIKTNMGVLFISEIESKVYLLSDSPKNISVDGLNSWFENNLKPFLSKQFFDNLGVNYPYDNNPSNPIGVGYISTNDTRFNRIIITKRDYLYLGDWSKVVTNFNPALNYTADTIFIDSKGWHKIIYPHILLL